MQNSIGVGHVSVTNGITAAGTLNVTGKAVVGGNVEGDMTIDGAGAVVSIHGTLDDGAQSGGLGGLSVTGSGAKLAIDNDWIIGDAGTHTDSIIRGSGGVSTDTVGGTLTLGNQGSGVGSLTISGTSQALTAGKDVIVGGAGTGTLMVENGGSLLVSGGVVNVGTAGGGGSLDVGFNAFVTAVVSQVGGVGRLSLAGGIFDATTLTVQGEVSGFGSFTGITENDGIVKANGGTLVLQKAVTGTGSLSILAGATLDLGGASSTGQTVTFNGSGLTLEQAHVTSATLSGFGAGSVIDVKGVVAADRSFSGGVLTLFDATSAVIETLKFSDAFVTQNFVIASDGGTGTAVTYAPCFAAGTRIATDSGELAVEQLRAGDLVRAASGSLVAIKWIGTRRMTRLHEHPEQSAVQPLCVAKGALAQGCPARDLMLSPDHALLLEGKLIPVKALINGRSIRQLSWAEVTYFHVELPQHDILLAEGAEVESYLDTGNSSAFDNFGPAVQLYPEFCARSYDIRRYAPFAEQGVAVEAARRAILARVEEAATELAA